VRGGYVGEGRTHGEEGHVGVRGMCRILRKKKTYKYKIIKKNYLSSLFVFFLVI
jgi:hypothetical protein